MPYETSAIETDLRRFASREAPPPVEELIQSLSETREVMRGLPQAVRPCAENGPGALVILPGNTPTLIIPDLHGRRDFLLEALDTPLVQGRSFFELLQSGKGSVVCVGDAFHGEAPVRERWEQAYKEYTAGFKRHKAMDAEMTDNLGLLEMVLLLTRSYSERFFFLKGNHENIRNELGGGNYPFRKFVYEGEMVLRWTEQFLGSRALDELYTYEKSLPLVAEGDGFLVTHAEPIKAMGRTEVINAYGNDDLVYGLTWTGNGDAEEGSVAAILEDFFPGRENTLCFGGHRPVNGLYDLRNRERYVQINHPVAHIVAVIRRGEGFSPDEDIFRIDTQNRARGIR